MWYIRDEWARDHKVLHPHGGVLYKSGVYAAKVLNLTPGDLPFHAADRRVRGEPAEGTAMFLDHKGRSQQRA